MASDVESQAIKDALDAWWRKVEQHFLYGGSSGTPVGFLSNDAVAAGEIVVGDQSMEDALIPMLLGHPIVETDELVTPPVVFGRPEPDNKAMRMYRLWRAGLLPPDVTVIEIPVERTAYGYYRFSIPDYGPPRVAVQDNDTSSKALRCCPGNAH